MVRVCVLPCESITGIGVEKVASADPSAALALRLAVMVKLAVGVGCLRPLIGTTMFEMRPVADQRSVCGVPALNTLTILREQMPGGVHFEIAGPREPLLARGVLQNEEAITLNRRVIRLTCGLYRSLGKRPRALGDGRAAPIMCESNCPPRLSLIRS